MVREKSVNVAVELIMLTLVDSFIDLFMGSVCLINIIFLATLSEQCMYQSSTPPTCSSKTLNLILLLRRLMWFQ
jgi:hypothetical protein